VGQWSSRSRRRVGRGRPHGRAWFKAPGGPTSCAGTCRAVRPTQSGHMARPHLLAPTRSRTTNGAPADKFPSTFLLPASSDSQSFSPVRIMVASWPSSAQQGRDSLDLHKEPVLVAVLYARGGAIDLAQIRCSNGFSMRDCSFFLT
jgi:hypothetical protein